MVTEQIDGDIEYEDRLRQQDQDDKIKTSKKNDKAKTKFIYKVSLHNCLDTLSQLSESLRFKYEYLMNQRVFCFSGSYLTSRYLSLSDNQNRVYQPS